MKNPDKLNQKNAKSALLDTSRFVIWANWAFKTDHNLWGRKETEQLLLKTFIWSNSLECNSQWSESETTETDESGCWPESQSTNNTCSHLRPHCFSIINFFFFLLPCFLSRFFFPSGSETAKITEAVLKIKPLLLSYKEKNQTKKQSNDTNISDKKHRVISYQVNKTVTFQRDA